MIQPKASSTDTGSSVDELSTLSGRRQAQTGAYHSIQFLQSVQNRQFLTDKDESMGLGAGEGAECFTEVWGFLSEDENVLELHRHAGCTRQMNEMPLDDKL